MRSKRPERKRGLASAEGRARKRAGWLCAAGCIAPLVLAAGVGLLVAHAQQVTFQLPAIDPPGAATKAAEPNQPAALKDRATTDPQKQDLEKQCAELLKMATDLKSEVDKTTKDTLSVTVVRKADQIEQFARKVRLGDGKS